jgi:hypothetical protein
LHGHLWRAFLVWEHEARRMIRGRRDFMPSDAAPNIEDEIGYNDEDDEMEDMTPAVVMLEALVPNDYNEDMAMAAALEASKVDEESKWS